jgi:FMN phosphatase YigB (HAD superfamily)
VTGLAAALVDVGGTLWPDRWPSRPDDQLSSARRLCAVFGDLSLHRAKNLVSALETAAITLSTDHATEQVVDRYVGETLRTFGLPASPQDASAVLSAMCIAAHGRVELFPDADELLQTLRRHGLRCAIVSNAVWRDNAAYWRDFSALGVAPLVDAVVSSVDVGYRKPHRAIFEAGAAAVGVALADCLVVGNSESRDVRPAKALGLPVVRVALEEPVPAQTQADRVASSLREAAGVVSLWCRRGPTC